MPVKGCEHCACYGPNANPRDFVHVNCRNLQVACRALSDELSDYFVQRRQVQYAGVLDDCVLDYPEICVFERRQQSSMLIEKQCRSLLECSRRFFLPT